MADFKIKALSWLAPVAMVGALGLAACGDDSDASVQTRGAAVVANGSDRHLENLADEISRRQSDVVGSDVHLNNQAAEIAEAQAGIDQPADTDTAEPSSDDFVAGTRRMPVR